MQKIALRAIVLTGITGLLPSCFTAMQEARVVALEAQTKELAHALEQTSHELSSLTIELENKERQASRAQHCKDPSITEFMDGIQGGMSSACTPISLAKTLNFLDKIPTAVVHLRPGSGVNDLLKTRIGQIRRMLDVGKEQAGTRVLVMVKPVEDTEAGRAYAQEVAEKVTEHIVRKELVPAVPHASALGSSGAAPTGASGRDGVRAGMRPREVPVLGPFLLPCELADDMSRLYRKPYFRPIDGEPKQGKPALVIFVVVSPC
jgi:hypothetical protein